jgi:uncharacterized protein YfaS (alpha-2-macroglobulin family)
VAAALVR